MWMLAYYRVGSKPISTRYESYVTWIPQLISTSAKCLAGELEHNFGASYTPYAQPYALKESFTKFAHFATSSCLKGFMQFHASTELPIRLTVNVFHF